MKNTSVKSMGFKAALGFTVGFGALMASGVSTAIAQDDAAESTDTRRLATVTTTAAKREQTLQDVPIAVSVIDDTVIEKANIIDIIDLQSVVPSLRVSQLQQSGNTTFLIRGFGNGGNNVGIEPSVAVFIDGVYRTRASGGLADYADISRIEVLKGPQSTLFGKNASVGVISVVTEKPQFEFGGKVEATIGNYDAGILKGTVTGPLNDKAAVSFSAGINKRDGYAEDLGTGNSLNDRDRYFVKGQLLLEPSDDISLRFIVDHDKLDEICCYAPNIVNGARGGAIAAIGGQIVTDPFSFTTALDTAPTNEISNTGISAQVDWETPIGTVTSISAVRTQDHVSDGDVDFSSAAATSQNLLDFDTDMFSQEIRLTGDTDNFAYLLGAYYFDESVTQNSNVLYGEDFRNYADVLLSAVGASTAGLEFLLGETPGSFFAPGTGSEELFKQDNESYSLFGQVDFDITDRLTATLGLSYISDEKDVSATVTNSDTFAAIDLATAFNNQPAVEALAGAPLDQIVLGQVAAGNIPGVDLATYNALLGGAALGDPTSVATIAAINANVQAGTAAAIAGQLTPFQFLPPFIDFPNAVEGGSTSDDDITYTARLAYDLTDSLNIYGSYATGFKASSWNLTRDSSYLAANEAALAAEGLLETNRIPGTRFAAPESTQVFEIGAKLSLDTFTFNAALFNQTVENFQSTLFNGTGFNLLNAGEQTTTGFEWDATWAATDNLTLTFSGIVQDPNYEDFSEGPTVWQTDPTTGAIVETATGQDLTGQSPAGISETSLYFGGDYSFDISDGAEAFIRADYVYESDTQVVDNIAADILSREIGTINAAAGVDFDNGVSVLLWGKNLNDDEYFTSGFPTVAQAGSINGYANAPKTYGVTLRKTF